MTTWEVQLSNGKWVKCSPLTAAMWVNIGQPARLV
jgi:hypothetical protein